MKDALLRKLNYLMLCLLAVGFIVALGMALRSAAQFGPQDYTQFGRPVMAWQPLEPGALPPAALWAQDQGAAGQVTLAFVNRLDDQSVAQGLVNLLHCKTAPGAVTVLIGDRLVHSCSGAERSITALSCDHYIPIDKADFGAPIYIVLRLLPGGSGAALQSAVLTTRAGALVQASLEHFWRSCLSFAILMVGVLLVLAYFVMLRYLHYPPMLWLGLFLTCRAVWNNPYLGTLMKLSNDRQLCHLLRYPLIALAGIASLLFVFYIGQNRHARLFDGLITLVLLGSAVPVVACLVGVSDQLCPLWLAEAALITSGSIGLGTLLLDYHRHKALRRPTVVGLAGAAIGAAAGMVGMLLGQGDLVEPALDLGLLFFTLCFAVGLLSSGIDALVEKSRLRTLELAVYRDQLTGCENRRAFDQQLAAYRHSGYTDTLEGLAIVMFDSNNLKMINDTHGHARGDQLIIKTADALRRYLGDFGAVYRIGGDEFVVVCSHVDRRALVHALEAFDHEANNSDVWAIDVSWGVAYYKADIDCGPESILARAERRMYEYKKAIQAVSRAQGV